LNNLLDMAAMDPEALSLMMGEPEGNVNTLRQVTGRKKRAKSITAQDYLNAMRSQSQEQMTHYPSKKVDAPHWMDYAAMATMGAPILGDAIGLAADARMFAQEPESRTKLNYGLSALGAMPFIPSLGMVKAFHGTPHKVDKFKMDKIGTGEGAQSYGHGLYFAENPKVAGQYQYDLSRNVGNINATPSAHKYAADDFFKNDYSLEDAREGMKAAYPDITDMELETALNESYRTQGNLYNVNLDVNPEDLLDWDAPLHKQPEILNKIPKEDRAIMEGMLADFDQLDDLSDYTGNELRQILRRTVNEGYFPEGHILGTNDDIAEEALSAYLKQQGIPGIQYYDGMSRGRYGVKLKHKGKNYTDAPVEFATQKQADDYLKESIDKGFEAEHVDVGTRNYVMFDENLIEIANPSSLNDLVKPK